MDDAEWTATGGLLRAAATLLWKSAICLVLWAGLGQLFHQGLGVFHRNQVKKRFQMRFPFVKGFAGFDKTVRRQYQQTWLFH